MIEQIRFCPNHYWKIKSPEVREGIQFKEGYTALIGPNTIGKSTILEAIALCPHCAITKTPNTRIAYLNQERLNPQFNSKGYLGLEEMRMAIRSLFSSCGEIGKDVLKRLGYAGENCFLIDSPEMGQDLEGVEILLNGFNRLVKSGSQVIIATHNLRLLSNANILELEKGYLERLVQATEKDLEPFNI